MTMVERSVVWAAVLACVVGGVGTSSCRATVAGDPDRPIKIEAHITLDVRQVKEAAQSIEDMVSGGAPARGKKTSRVLEILEARAWAAEPELKVITPEVQAAIDARRARYDRLKGLKDQGLVGEDNQGHASALVADPLAEEMVKVENSDREVIYRAIVEQNNLGRDAIGTIRAAFGEVHREKASPGEKIQLPSGEWTTK